MLDRPWDSTHDVRSVTGFNPQEPGTEIRTVSLISRDEFGPVVDHAPVAVFAKFPEDGTNTHPDVHLFGGADHLGGEARPLIQFDDGKGVRSLLFKAFGSGADNRVSDDFTCALEPVRLDLPKTPAVHAGLTRRIEVFTALHAVSAFKVVPAIKISPESGY
jgi:hypothetical protein